MVGKHFASWRVLDTWRGRHRPLPTPPTPQEPPPRSSLTLLGGWGVGTLPTVNLSRCGRAKNLALGRWRCAPKRRPPLPSDFPFRGPAAGHIGPSRH